MNIVKYLSEKIKKGLKKTKLYAATAILTVTTATVGTLTACTSKTNDNSKEPTKVVTEIPEVTTTPTITPTPTQPVEVETVTVIEPYVALSSFGGVERTQYNRITSLSHDDARFYTTSKIISDHLKEYDIKGNMNVLAYHLGKTDSNYANYYDIYLALDSAKYLSDNEKNILRGAIKNLEIQADNHELSDTNYDLTGLYYNLPDLQVRYYNDIAHPYKVHFNPYDKIVGINTAYVTSQELEEALVLGCIGYPSIKAYAEIGGKKLYASTTVFCMNIKGDEIIEFGESFEDALATIIAKRALKQPITPDNTQYYADIELFNIYLNLANMTPAKYQNYGYSGIVSAIHHNNMLDGVISNMRRLDVGPRTQGAWMAVTSNNEMYHSVATETLGTYILHVFEAFKNDPVKYQDTSRNIEILKGQIRNICTPRDFEIVPHRTLESGTFNLDDIIEEMNHYIDENSVQNEMTRS